MLMRNYQYIFVDWGVNLAKTLEIWLEAWRTLLEKRGLNPLDKAIAVSIEAFTAYIEARAKSMSRQR